MGAVGLRLDADVEFVVGDDVFPAHQVVLRARCHAFKEEFLFKRAGLAVRCSGLGFGWVPYCGSRGSGRLEIHCCPFSPFPIVLLFAAVGGPPIGSGCDGR